MKRRRGKVSCSQEVLVSLFGMPEETKIVTINYNPVKDVFDMYLTDGDFLPEVEEGHESPDVDWIM